MMLKEKGFLDGIEFVSCYDLSESKASDFAIKYGLELLRSLNALDQALIDFAIVSTPSGTHYEVGRECVSRHIPTLIEKPITLRVEEANELEEFAKSNKVLVKSVFQNRYNLAIKEAKSILDSGQLGKIVTFSLRTLWCRYQEYYEDDWHGKWASDGGVSSQQAIHHLDALNYLIGLPDNLCAFAGNRVNELEAEDTLVAIFNICGMLGTGQFTTAIRPRDLEASITIIGEQSSLRVSGVALNRLELLDSKGEYITTVEQKFENGYGLGHAELLKEFSLLLQGHESSYLPSCQDSIKALMVVDALYESVESGKVINVQRTQSRSKLGIK
jgi:predicted dehydrogenase